MTPLKVIYLGETSRSLSAIESWCNDHKADFSEDTYDFLNHNCNHFTDALAKFLTGTGIPNEILNQHELIARNPQGSVILNMIQTAQTNAKQVQQQGGVGGFLATGRPIGQVAPVPIWTQNPDDFENEVIRLWNNTNISMESKKEALRCIYLISETITRHPTDPTKRQLNSDDDAYKAINAVPHGQELIKIMGFVTDSQGNKIIPNINRDILIRLRKIMELLKNVGSATVYEAGATKPSIDYSNELKQLEEMGFLNRQLNLELLQKNNGNITTVLNFLTPEF